ncbi:MAG: cupin domain-containing protein [Methanobacteriaceae archaeon]
MTKIPDVLQVTASGYNLLMENEKVRVMEMRLKPGQKSPMHNHPHDHVVYVFKDAKFKLSFPDGKNAEFELRTGETLWIEAGPHETQNIGSTEGHNLVIETKE